MGTWDDACDGGQSTGKMHIKITFNIQLHAILFLLNLPSKSSSQSFTGKIEYSEQCHGLTQQTVPGTTWERH